ncbi:MAG: Holliday junction branch migration protein RuvA, partial [Pseudomonadales bacterium]
PKLALTIMSGMEASALAECIHNEDAGSLSALPGVGKKTAEQMIIDLRGKLPEFLQAFGGKGANLPASSSGRLADAESALIGLGFKPQEAARALSTVADENADVASLIKQALKALG